MTVSSFTRRVARTIAPLLIVAAFGAHAPAGRAAASAGGSIAVGPSIAFGCYWDSSCVAFVSTCRRAFARTHGVSVSIVNLAAFPQGAAVFTASGTDLNGDGSGASWIAFRDSRCADLQGGIDEPGVAFGAHVAVSIPRDAAWAIVGARNGQRIRWSLTPA